MQKENICPHCGKGMEPWDPGPEGGWADDMFICNNNSCSYFVNGRKKIANENKVNFAYRYFYNPSRNKGGAVAVWCGGDLSLLKGRCAGA